MTAQAHTTSYYAASANEKQLRPALTDNIDADVCVIGAGFTGLSSALHLAKAGFKVVVLEANRIAFGASGRNGGQIVHSYSRDIDFIHKHYGKETGTAMASMAFEGGEIIRGLVDEFNIQCDLKDGGIFAACNDKQMRELEGKKPSGRLTATASWNCSTPQKFRIISVLAVIKAVCWIRAADTSTP